MKTISAIATHNHGVETRAKAKGKLAQQSDLKVLSSPVDNTAARMIVLWETHKAFKVSAIFTPSHTILIVSGRRYRCRTSPIRRYQSGRRTAQGGENMGEEWRKRDAGCQE